MRKRKTIAQAKSLMERYQLSGLSVASFCTSEQISTVTFYYWRRCLHELNGQVASMLVPVCFDKPEAHGEEHSIESRYEVTYPNGVRLSVSSGESLAQLRELVKLF